jgi:hypothetical protein
VRPEEEEEICSLFVYYSYEGHSNNTSSPWQQQILPTRFFLNPLGSLFVFVSQQQNQLHGASLGDTSNQLDDICSLEVWVLPSCKLTDTRHPHQT